MSTCALLVARPRDTQNVLRRPSTLGHAANWQDEDSDSPQPLFECRDGRSLPRYTDRNVNLPDGLYLGLFNGRDAPLTASPGSGFDGPLIGRLRYCHTIEAREIKLEFLDPFEGRLFFPDMEIVAGPDGHVPTGRITLPVQSGLSSGAIVFDDRYFADWTVFIISSVRTVIGRDLRSQQRV
ncbi:hypothetical protein [Paraburkholderia susongensis]|uniref:Uncharacterized protein n=1 Tax=Paraburkholderia susongensis TaxID=1515439 RepID=A0A1X7M4N8_9BURK|nr:hypothetical protein [Paraburkholderia susongensis]SMG61021.1 hypothetical protein SAMN06265784_11912 [Paraburkholderia susongensis]